MKALFLALTMIVMSFSAQASSGKCAELRKELAAMKNAQAQIMNSLVNNHETFASSLEEYSETVTTAQGKSSIKSISKNMNQSAKAFRARGVQGQRMAGKLEKATDDLFARVASCLK